MSIPKVRSTKAKPQTVSVGDFYRLHQEALGLHCVTGEIGFKKLIKESTVNRPGLALAGFTRYFAYKRVQVVGSAEATYLKTLSRDEKKIRYNKTLAHKIPCVVFGRNIVPDKLFIDAAIEAGVPVFRSPLITMKLINRATLALEMMFAPRGSVMGSMVDILGIGVIIQGESGIGKSESVLALIERGYSLVADDLTKVTLVDGTHVVGTSSEITRDHMEVRGIGIINVGAMFGVKSIRKEKKIDLIVELKTWQKNDDMDRLGIENQYSEILGLKIPKIILPIRPGRDMARLIEVAAFQTKLKMSGYNAAKALDDRLLNLMSGSSD